MRVLIFLGLALFTAATQAQWTEDADQCARLIGDNQRAIRHCTAAIESGVLDVEDLGQTYSNRAFLYWEEGELNAGIRDAHKAVELDDRNPMALNMVGYFYLRKDEREVTDGAPSEIAANYIHHLLRSAG